MANRSADIIVAGKLFAKAIAKRLRSRVESPPDLHNYSSKLQALLENAEHGLVAESYWLHLPATEPPWVTTKLNVQAGDEVSYFLLGRVYANRFLDIWINACTNIWCKLGDDGEIFRGTQNGHSFTAERSGQLQFGNYFPNDWINAQGVTKRSDDDYATVSGESKILIIKWAGSALQGLRSLAMQGDYCDYFKNEINRLEQVDKPPLNWNYLWNLGPAEIYHDATTDDGRACIHCSSSEDVGILQYEVDLALDPNTAISWRWLVQRLPSAIREDSLPSHDYLSLAVEFDNGRDLSYYWSASLPEGYGYDCPIPSWQGKEYHVVVRSGEAELGVWLNEQRNIYQDYQQYIGEPPARVVKVWLIANSIFQRNQGVCTYSDIVVHQAGKDDIRIL